MINADTFKKTFHSKPVEEVLLLYETDEAKGLSQEESAIRLKANELGLAYYYSGW